MLRASCFSHSRDFHLPYCSTSFSTILNHNLRSSSPIITLALPFHSHAQLSLMAAGRELEGRVAREEDSSADPGLCPSRLCLWAGKPRMAEGAGGSTKLRAVEGPNAQERRGEAGEESAPTALSVLAREFLWLLLPCWCLLVNS